MIKLNMADARNRFYEKSGPADESVSAVTVKNLSLWRRDLIASEAKALVKEVGMDCGPLTPGILTELEECSASKRKVVAVSTSAYHPLPNLSAATRAITSRALSAQLVASTRMWSTST